MEIEGTNKFTRTVVTRTNYGSESVNIGVGNAGAVNTSISSRTAATDHVSLPYIDDMEPPTDTYSSMVTSRMDHGNGGDLSSYKKRIDANVEQQREHADMMTILQRKVEEYRRRITDIETQIDCPRSDETVSFNIPEVGEVWSVDNVTLNRGADYEVNARFDDERRRNEELRIRNDQLQAEIKRMHQQYDVSLRDKERAYQNRERNLAQYLSEEQKKMMDLWTELQMVRRQCSEYKDQTERDLENQKNEFVKVMRNVGGVARQLNIVGGSSILSEGGGSCAEQDNVIVEALQRFRENQGTMVKGDEEFNTELMHKYEEAIERVVELETRGDGNGDRVPTLEADLRRTNDRLRESLEALRKINSVAKRSRDRETDQRSRSLSPAGDVVPSEVVRNVRATVRSRDNDIQQMQRKLRNAQMEIHELATRVESAEEARMRLDKQLTESKREIVIQQKAVDEATRNVRRLDDRARAAESDRTTAEKARMHLEEELRRLKLVIDQSAANGEKKAIEDAEDRARIIEDEYNIRMSEITRRVDSLLDEKKRMKNDFDELKDRHRNLETEYSAIQRKVDEKDVALKHLEDIKRDLLTSLNEQRTRFEAVTSELDMLQSCFSSTSRKSLVFETSITDIKKQRDDIVRERDDLAHQLKGLKQKIDVETKAKEEIERASKRNVEEIERLKDQITENESELMALRRHNDDLETQQQTSHAKTITLDNSLTAAHCEISKLNELNAKLQKEKNDILNLKQTSDTDLDQLRERIHKVEQETAKIKVENKSLQESEQKAIVAQKEETNKCHLLRRELEDAKVEIDEMRRKLHQLDADNNERLEFALRTSKAPSEVTEETVQVTEVRLREASDKFNIKLEKIENEREDLLRRVRTLEDDLNDKRKIIEEQIIEIGDQKDQNENEVDKIRVEMATIQAKYQSEIDDERDQHNQNIETMKATEDDLRNKLVNVENKLEETRSKERNLLHEINGWEQKHVDIVKDLKNARDDIDTIREDADREIHKWKNTTFTAHDDLKAAQSTIDSLKAQMATANDRVASLTKSVNEQSSIVRDLNCRIRRLEEDLTDSKGSNDTDRNELERTLARLKNAEELSHSIQLENSELRNERDTLQRDIDILKNTTASQTSETDRLKTKVDNVSRMAKENTDELQQVRAERDHFENIYREKMKVEEQLTETVKTHEAKSTRMRKELQEAKDKFIEAEIDWNSMRAEVKKLEQEVHMGKEHSTRKNDEFRAAIEDVANAHRIAEDGRVNALQELESSKFEINDLQSRLDNADQRLASLQQDYLNADKEREVLSDSIRRVYSIIARSVSLVIPEGGVTDNQSIDVHVQKLISRIDKLERERNEYRESVGRMKRKTSDSEIAINKHETIYRTVEEKLTYVEEGKRSVDLKLASTKELVKSQEETLKHRDEERRQMKSRIAAIDLETRGKDAQIRHLNDMVKKLKNELDTSQQQIRRLRDRSEEWGTKKIQLQSKAVDRDGESQKITMITSTFEAEKQNLNESLKKLATKLQESESKNTDLNDDANRLKKDLVKAERLESELRRNLDEQTRSAREGQTFREQLTLVQSDLANANNRKQQLEDELMNVRGQLRDQKQLVHDTTTRLTDVQRQLQDAHSEKNRISDKQRDIGRTVTQLRQTENELRQQLTRDADERRALQAEMDNLKRRTVSFESERNVTHANIEELTKVRVILVRKLDVLEVEKRKAEAMIEETASQREAIENSLNALERENKELCRNCVQLQQQIAQLELDNGNRLITLTNKQKEEHDRFVRAVKAEKVQVERIIQNRDLSQKNRIKQLENQVVIVREQLDRERARRRDATDRVMLNDISKLSSASFSMGNSGIASAGGVYPQPNSFDHIIASRSGYASSFLTTPYTAIGTSDPYRMSSPAMTTREPVQMAQSPYSSSYHTAGMSSMIGGTNSSMESSKGISDSESRKKTTITVHMKGSDYSQ